MRTQSNLFAILVAGGSLLLSLSAASSQTTRPVKLVIPYPPGGGADVLARVLVNAIGDMNGPTIVVENRPGAGTVIGTEDVVRADPDGNTLLLTNNALLLVPHLRKLDYDPLTSLEPICRVGSTPSFAIVNAASSYHTLDDLIGAARAKPGALTFGAGVGALSQITYEMLMHRAIFRMTMVPFTGTAPETNAVYAGQIDTAFVDYPPAAGLLRSGKLRALATSAIKRAEWLPDVPTVDESGYKGFQIDLWYGIFAPAHTAPQITSQFAQWFAKAADSPETRSKLAAPGIEAASVCGTPFVSYLHKSFDEYGDVIRDANIKAE
ncbi:MAG TPA: tripartite tricarboxylate transporter substrate binding protein [Xanthobacteraceae bacterium]|nr:tripartite tricarboxylate transporter substrate binding protein [Xanthobacteraceae bacterium]